jgi:NRPS condensation-like uncharacterized protein
MRSDWHCRVPCLTLYLSEKVSDIMGTACAVDLRGYLPLHQHDYLGNLLGFLTVTVPVHRTDPDTFLLDAAKVIHKDLYSQLHDRSVTRLIITDSINKVQRVCDKIQKEIITERSSTLPCPISARLM